MPFVHDPSTVVHFHGKYYVFSTGRGAPFYSSPDGLTWTREGSVFTPPPSASPDAYQGAIPEAVHAAVPKNNGSDVWAPDIIRLNGQFYIYYAVSSWGSFQSVVGLVTNPALDPKDPAYKWTDHGVVVSSNGNEDLNAIDPGVMLAPDGTLWLCYGSYHGSIRVTQLDPKTGLALKPNTLGAPIATARESEASDMIYHDGFYYLFVNHGSCCKGKNSEYNIRVGRSRKPDGDYVDKHGDPMSKAGGSLFLAAHDHRIGPGHFGRVVDYDAEPPEKSLDLNAPFVAGEAGGLSTEEAGSEAAGAERFSVHYEADTTRGGRSVLDIRPLLWSMDGWPMAGDNLVEGTYQIVSRRSENTMEEFKQPGGGLVPRLTRYLTLDNQKWTIAPVGDGFYKIVNAATGDALGSNGIVLTFGSLIGLTPYTGADSQMWHLDQFPDGGWRIRNKAAGLSLRAGGSDVVALNPFVQDDWSLWTITTP
jgi:arabinan endo-1,5-alpha-L-arabinosidase